MGKIKRYNLQNHVWKSNRGWGINPFEVIGRLQETLGNVHVISITPGAVRGNHLHTNATEWILIFGGPSLLVWRSSDNDVINEINIKDDQAELFEIPPNVEHAVKNNSNRDIYLISFNDSFDKGTLKANFLLE
ncbi:MAG: hypothetical protein JSV13_02900 [Nitrospiraceae bacterium]|nr:MAG: hypothetical protein JSV13_02900 [Nitrospiraceae bacterium]